MRDSTDPLMVAKVGLAPRLLAARGTPFMAAQSSAGQSGCRDAYTLLRFRVAKS